MLAGCSSGGDGAGFEALFAEDTALFQDFQSVGPTMPDDLPINGSGTYEGFFSATPEFDSDPNGFEPLVLGRTTMVVEFGGSSGNPAGTFSGSAGDFVNGDDVAVAGSVTYSGTFTGADMTGTMSGTFQAEAGTINATGGLDGGFSGPTGEFVQADVTGGTLSGADTGTFTGGILAERTTCSGC